MAWEPSGIVRRVAVIAYHSSPLREPGSGDAGGMTVYVRHLARALAERGVDTDIFTRASDPADRAVSVEPGIRVIPIDAGPRRVLPKEELPQHLGAFAGSVAAFALSQRISYDVMHSHYWQSGVAAARLARRWDIPLVHSAHTLAKVKNLHLAPGEGPESEPRLAGETEVLAAADVLVASTDAEYEQIACLYGAAHDRLKTVPPGVDHEVFSPGSRSQARRELGLDARPILLSVGRIQSLKGVALAIQAVEELRHVLDPEPLLLIVGGASGAGGEREVARLQELTAELGLQDHVRFCGPQRHHELPRYYRAADAVLVCSHSESFGLTALEAHSCGRPVVGTPVGGLSHVVQDGVSGYLLAERDPAECAARLKSILSDPAIAERFSQSAELSAARFSWDETAARFHELYECLVEERSPEFCTC